MRLALALARRGLGLTSPNPAVGALVVGNGKVMGKGWHRRPGEAHAEVLAIQNFHHVKRGKKLSPASGGQGIQNLRDATLYVTLEPCCTFGRTPPCTDAIIRAGIRRVVVGATDPNPKHAGRGLKIMRSAGVMVTTGVLEEECQKLNEAFNKWITTGLPFVIAKAAMTLDGKIADKNGHSKWITSLQSRLTSHQLRAQVDAILVGAQTLRSDNPRLTARSRGAQRARDSGQAVKQPWRIILTRSGRLPRKAHVFNDPWRERTLVAQNKSWPSLLRTLGRWDITSLLIEGGGKTLASAFEAGVVNKVVFFYAPKLIGGLRAITAVEGNGMLPIQLERVRWRRTGKDLMVEAYVQRNH